jgi:ferredoxin
MSAKEKSTFSHFFKEDAFTRELIKDAPDKPLSDEAGIIKKTVIPEIDIAKEISEDESTAYWQKLRAFFRNGNNAKGLPDDMSPVILSPLYTKAMVGSDFPVWVADESFSGNAGFCLSLKEILIRGLREIGSEEETPILNEHIELILHKANTQLQDKKPQNFQAAISNILKELEKELAVTGDEADSFKNNLKKLSQALPDNGALVPYSNNTSFQMLEAAMVSTLGQPREKLKQEFARITSQLNDLLRVEEDNNPSKKSPEKAKDSFDFANSMVNFDEISSMSPHGGSESIGKDRIKRIVASVKVLAESETLLSQQGFVFVDELLFKNKNIDWSHLFANNKVESYKKGTGCDTVGGEFKQCIAKWTKLFVAKRIADLEISNNYQADIHDDYFEHFMWENLSGDELDSCPHFVLIADDVQLFDTEFGKLSSLFSNNIPVKIVAVSKDHYGGAKDAVGLHTQTELGALMLSHKNIFVAQSTSITPIDLFNGFKDGLNAFAPAFYNILNVDEATFRNPYLWTSTTVESRDFPGFTFNGILGTPWGSRFDIKNNPQPEKQWSVHELPVIDSNGDKVDMVFPFTFADQASLNPDYHNHFIQVSPSYWNDNLIPLTDYMDNSVEENIGNVPFIWLIDREYKLHKVAVSWHLVIAAQERLDFWRFLQENSGINNYHVTKAVEDANLVAREQHDKETAQLREEHEAEILKIREEEAGKVMENLTSVLLNLDTTNLVTASPGIASPSPTTDTGLDTAEPVPQETPVAEQEEESTLSNDPYIDTAMCTSCNECTNLNGQMFKYNGDKMAYIADPKAGTFSDLVEAAEKCPVKIIHPGSPLNPDEPDLDDLVERAAKFN